MKKNISAALAVLAVVWLISNSFGWPEQDSERVAIKLYSSQEKVHRKSELLVALEVSVAGGWHINSNAPYDEFLVPTSIDLISDQEFRLSSVQYPDPVQLTLPFSEAPVSVFEGIFFITVVIEIPDELELGEYEVSLEFSHQACDDLACQAPKTIRVVFPIPVVESSIPVEKINTDIFSKIKFRK
jgi:hypothetical protein